MGKTGSAAPLGWAMRDCLRALGDGECLGTPIVACRIATDYPTRLARAALQRLEKRRYVERYGWRPAWQITKAGRRWLYENEEGA